MQKPGRVGEVLRESFWRQIDSDPQAGGGQSFCFVNISGAAAIQLIESASDAGIYHYGFVTDNVEQAAKELRRRNAEIIREIRNADGKLTTLFVKDHNGLKMEVRLPLTLCR